LVIVEWWSQIALELETLEMEEVGLAELEAVSKVGCAHANWQLSISLLVVRALQGQSAIV